MSKIKLEEIKVFRGTLKVLGSGLRIGGTKDIVGIGETDNPIIRHPITRLPYVPGSSVKGKLRSLLESKYCEMTQISGRPCGCGTCFVCQLFGCGATGSINSPSRLVFRDSQPTDATRQTWEQAGTSSEVKSEVQIDRNKGLAAHGALRTMERIPADSDFDFELSIRVFEGDNVADLLGKLAEGFELMESHYLGGSGSRGYGKVAIVAEDGASMAEHLRRQSA